MLVLQETYQNNSLTNEDQSLSKIYICISDLYNLRSSLGITLEFCLNFVCLIFHEERK